MNFHHEGTKNTKKGKGLEFEALSRDVIGCAIEVHKVLGPGLLESAYEECLVHELGLHGISHSRQHPLQIEYKGVQLDCGYRIDVLVGKTLILELKAVERLLPIHEAQVLTYMRIARVPVGLLINFNVPRLRDGIKRFVL
jgi:GxxExxY protein